ncbi:DUF3240 family protein [Ottowia sp. VDI28]|uniref:DUF3240 family protein n=1 Tax=Ottowia sp. VDI28 TaxID=3133968 RepID=UPI003C2E67ED
MSELCLTVLCPPEVEEKLLDALLANVTDRIFTTTPTFSHGMAHGLLDKSEQVMGRSHAIQLQILTGPAELTELLETLRVDFAGTGLRYWTVPLSHVGEIK